MASVSSRRGFSVPRRRRRTAIGELKNRGVLLGAHHWDALYGSALRLRLQGVTGVSQNWLLRAVLAHFLSCGASERVRVLSWYATNYDDGIINGLSADLAVNWQYPLTPPSVGG